MDLDGLYRIIPVTASRSLALAGCQSIQQAIPEEYALASFVMRALEARNGRELEFILKAYLPVHLIRLGPRGQCVLIDMLGLFSAEIVEVGETAVEGLSRALSEIDSTSLNVAPLDSISHALAAVRAAEVVSVPGLISGASANDLARLIGWPKQSDLELGAIVLPSIINREDLSKYERMILQTFDRVQRLRREMAKILPGLEPMLRASEDGLAALAPTVARLDDRISRLENELERLTSRLQSITSSKLTSPQLAATEAEVRSQIDLRTTALMKDRERRERLIEDQRRSRESFSIHLEGMKTEYLQTQEFIDSLWSQYESLSVDCGCFESDSPAVLLVPLVIAGFSKRGVLEVTVYPPSVMDDQGVKTSRRKEFADPFVPLSQTMTLLASLIEKRIDSDITLRKLVRDSSATSNLLSDSTARRMLEEGARLLRADGLLRDSSADHLRALMSSVPERPSKATTHGAMLVTDESVCSVEVRVTDASGEPIAGARVGVGGLITKTDEHGGTQLRLPRSRYELAVNADGYRERRVEFELRSSGDVVIPVVLEQLTREDRLSLALEDLSKRADRIDTIRKKLLGIFQSQGDTILRVPAYRGTLEELLTELGYEPEAWLAEASRKRGMIGRLLKGEDRRDGMRRDILRIAEESKSSGGVMLLSDVLRRLDRLGWSANTTEVESILAEMTREGLIRGVSIMEDGTTSVNFVPVSLTDDPQLVLDLAAKRKGSLTIEDVVLELGWTESRVKNALQLLIEKGVAKEQRSFSKSTTYWFPGLRGRD
ncbi:MAG: carboxypeptidase regulatory-like domain-containing protein [Candidatus Thorarchaeota archaeon]|nr:carboxypeptidase regulatory-like domain-containing protein [Candidatus Thorarchaeota archaeon]